MSTKHHSPAKALTPADILNHPAIRNPEVKPGKNTVVNGKGYFLRPMNRPAFDRSMTRIFGPSKLDLALAKEAVDEYAKDVQGFLSCSSRDHCAIPRRKEGV